MTSEETEQRVKWAKSRGIVKIGFYNQAAMGNVISSVREVLSALDFTEVIHFIMEVQNFSYGFIMEIKQVPYEIEPDLFLKIANEVIASK